MRSAFLDIDGPLHYVDHGGTGRPILLVHGLGGSHANWVLVADELAAHGHVVAIDLPGFGRTPLLERSAAVPAQVKVVEASMAALFEEPAVLMGNSMGGLISMMAAVEVPHLVAGLVLVDPALPPPKPTAQVSVRARLGVVAVPVFGPRLMQRITRRLPPRFVIDQTLRMIARRPIPPEGVEAQVAMAERRRHMPWSGTAFAQATRSLVPILTSRRLFRDRVLERIAAPTLLIHGADDPLVPVESARWAASVRPDWEVHILEGVGHVPQLEVPERVIELTTDWLSRIERQAVA